MNEVLESNINHKKCNFSYKCYNANQLVLLRILSKWYLTNLIKTKWISIHNDTIQSSSHYFSTTIIMVLIKHALINNHNQTLLIIRNIMLQKKICVRN